MREKQNLRPSNGSTISSAHYVPINYNHQGRFRTNHVAPSTKETFSHLAVSRPFIRSAEKESPRVPYTATTSHKLPPSLLPLALVLSLSLKIQRHSLHQVYNVLMPAVVNDAENDSRDES